MLFYHVVCMTREVGVTCQPLWPDDLLNTVAIGVESRMKNSTLPIGPQLLSDCDLLIF